MPTASKCSARAAGGATQRGRVGRRQTEEASAVEEKLPPGSALLGGQRIEGRLGLDLDEFTLPGESLEVTFEVAMHREPPLAGKMPALGDAAR